MLSFHKYSLLLPHCCKTFSENSHVRNVFIFFKQDKSLRLLDSLHYHGGKNRSYEECTRVCFIIEIYTTPTSSFFI